MSSSDLGTGRSIGLHLSLFFVLKGGEECRLSLGCVGLPEMMIKFQINKRKNK